MSSLMAELKKLADTVDLVKGMAAREAIDAGMVWEETPQGRDYWIKVHQSVEAMIALKKIHALFSTGEV